MSAAAPTTFLTWLRGRSDVQLQLLLQLRPDLALPPPLDFGALAGRAGVRMSVQRALEQLNTFELRALDAMCLAEPPRDLASIARLLGDAPEPDVQDALRRLGDLALIWSDEAGPRPLSAVAEAVGAYPGGIGRPALDLLRAAPAALLVRVAGALRDAGALGEDDDPDPLLALAARFAQPDWVAARLASASEPQRSLLERIAPGPPHRRLPDAYSPTAGSSTAGSSIVSGAASSSPAGAGSGADPSNPSGDDAVARELILAGLLVPVDGGTVELPREVGLLLRGGRPWGAVSAQPPAIELGPSRRDVDGSASVEAQTALRLAEDLADRWSAQPPMSLRSGGIGVRDLRRTAKELGVAEPIAALYVEVAAAAGLIGPSAAMPPAWLPTASFDEWLERTPAQRWLDLALAWLEMPRRPGLVGGVGQRERTVSALSGDVSRTTMPSVRRQVLAVLGEAPAGAPVADVESVLDRLAWSAPRRDGELRSLAGEVLAEAAALGLTGAGGLSGYARALLVDDLPSAGTLLSAALPAPVDEFLVQPDLTVVVPGPPEPDLGASLRLLADLESSGGAYVYRLSEASLRRALDAGRTAADLRAFLTDRSRTPMPQALSYLIDDVARRHGSLRAGAVSAYLRSDDPALLDQAQADRGLAALRLHRLAPTVAVTGASVTDLLARLREAGFSPMPEDGDGLIVSAGPSPVRAPDRRRPDRVSIRRTSEVELAAVVARLRSSDAILSGAPLTPGGGPSVPGVTSARTLELLRTAIRGARTVGLAVAEAEGTVVARMLEPISLGGGHVRGYDPRSPDRLVSYPLHRITSVLDLGPVEAGLDEAGPAEPDPAAARRIDGWEDDARE